MLRRWMAAAMVVILVLSLGTWFLTRDTLPRRITIAAAVRGGLYVELAEILAAYLEARTGRPVAVFETRGSEDNRDRLLAGSVDLGVLQAGAVAMPGLAVLTPLYDDVVHVVVRRGRGIEELHDLRGRRVALGPPGSGMRASAEQVLGHYRLTPADLVDTEAYFLTLLDDPEYDAAVVTTGMLNGDLETLLGSGAFTLLPLLDAEAFAVRHPLFYPIQVPRGLYGEAPPVPAAPLATLATTAVLAARADVSDLLVRQALEAVYASDLRQRVPTLRSPAEASAWRHLPLHPVARRHFDPGDLDRVAAVMESLAATKELIVALGAGLYLLWARWRRIRERTREQRIRRMKDRLDALLDETARIEEAQIGVADPERLVGYLREVTRIKLTGLSELTHEDLRGDRMFLIFLIQCGNLISKLQLKLLYGTGHSTREPAAEMPAAAARR